jgi:hypothetical protein
MEKKENKLLEKGDIPIIVTIGASILIVSILIVSIVLYFAVSSGSSISDCVDESASNYCGEINLSFYTAKSYLSSENSFYCSSWTRENGTEYYKYYFSEEELAFCMGD